MTDLPPPQVSSPHDHHAQAESWLRSAEGLLDPQVRSADDVTVDADRMVLRAVEVMTGIAQVHATLATIR